jgi:hypothetical protein
MCVLVQAYNLQTANKGERTMTYTTKLLDGKSEAVRDHASWSDALCYLIEQFGADLDVSSAYRQLTADCGLCLSICGVFVTCTARLQ